MGGRPPCCHYSLVPTVSHNVTVNWSSHCLCHCELGITLSSSLWADHHNPFINVADHHISLSFQHSHHTASSSPPCSCHCGPVTVFSILWHNPVLLMQNMSLSEMTIWIQQSLYQLSLYGVALRCIISIRSDYITGRITMPGHITRWCWHWLSYYTVMIVIVSRGPL